ncbi:MAG TPA: hypothetical protein DCZ40_13595 [Lachnospiraceae bacterium]|nr:hypothetical protein [Lachnospiraceae bacterium]
MFADFCTRAKCFADCRNTDMQLLLLRLAINYHFKLLHTRKQQQSICQPAVAGAGFRLFPLF